MLQFWNNPTSRGQIAHWMLEEMGQPYTRHWLASDDRAKPDTFLETNRGTVAKDLDGTPVYLAKIAWDVG